MRYGALTIITVMCVLFLPFVNAYASCSNPTGVEGEVIYNEAQNVPQVCTGTAWMAMGALNPAAGGSGCSSPTGVEGEMFYNLDYHILQYCDGDDWQAASGAGEFSLSGPSGCADIGDLCADGTVFAGWHPITYEHLYIPQADQGNSLNWKNSVGINDISTDSTYDGQINTDQIPPLTAYPAFYVCKWNATGGYNDWYLPSQVELYYLWSVHETIEAAGNITNFDDADYWSSTEASPFAAWTQSFGSTTDGAQSVTGKNTGNEVRCIRR